MPHLPSSPTKRDVVTVMHPILYGTGSIYGMDNADTWQRHVSGRVGFAITTAVDQAALRPDVRTAAEHAANIRQVLNPPIADLADFFEVSRQAIYKWLSGESNPEPEKLARLQLLSQIADAFAAAGIARAGTLLKMKTFNDKSLMDLLKEGSNHQHAVATLITESRAMEASYQRSGLAQSKAPASNDWQSSISIPGMTEKP